MSDYKHRMSLAVPQAFTDMGLTIIETDDDRYYQNDSDFTNGLIT